MKTLIRLRAGFKLAGRASDDAARHFCKFCAVIQVSRFTETTDVRCIGLYPLPFHHIVYTTETSEPIVKQCFWLNTILELLAELTLGHS